MKAAFYTLGCKVNQAETASLQALFECAGWQVVPPQQPADAYIINSCAVTAAGEAKSRRWIARVRRQNPGAVVALTGCLPQALPERALAAEADVVTGTAERANLPELICRFMNTQSRLVDIHTYGEDARFEELGAGLLPGHTRAFLKIQDGCDGRCAYCIVPAARGPVRSRGMQDIVREAAALAEKGCAEVVLTGINLPSYGRDTGGDLAEVAEALEGVAGVRRVRLSSLDPHRVTEDQMARFAACGKLCGHFHLSLQSGCDATLARMRRPYTAAQYRAAAAALRRAMPGASLTTDVIVGFPGESEADHAASLAFVRDMAFLKVHVFPFSARPGTAAAQFSGQLPRAEKARRAAEMQAAADEGRARWIAARLGETHTALLETPAPGGAFTGYTESYIPVRVAAPTAGQGDIVAVRLAAYDAKKDVVLAELTGN